MIHIPQLLPLKLGQPFTHVKRAQKKNGESRFDIYLWYGEKIQVSLNNKQGSLSFVDNKKIEELKNLVTCIESFNGYTFILYQNGYVEVIEESTQKLCSRKEFKSQNSNQISKLAFIETVDNRISIVGIHLDGQGYTYLRTTKDKLLSNSCFIEEKFNKIYVKFYAHDEKKQIVALLNDKGDPDYLSLLVLGSTQDKQKEQKEEWLIPKIQDIIGFDFQSSNNNKQNFFIATEQRIYVYQSDGNLIRGNIQKAYEIGLQELVGDVDNNCLIRIFAQKTESSFENVELIFVFQKSVIRVGFLLLPFMNIIDLKRIKGITDEDSIQNYECLPGDNDQDLLHFCCISSADSIEQEHLFHQNLLFFKETIQS